MIGLGRRGFLLSVRGVALGLGAFAGLGCTPKIGDSCTISTDCSVNGDRLCDTTQTGGYCTIFNCEPNGCPDDSECVGFTEPTCSSAERVRFQRTFCMKTCKNNGDCRDGYACIDVTSDPARSIIDVNPSSTSICAVAQSPTDAATVSADAQPAVCSPFDGAFPGIVPDGGDAASGEGASEGSEVDAGAVDEAADGISTGADSSAE